MPLREHLHELRKRIVRAALGLLLGAVAGWFLYDPVVEALAAPLYAVADDRGTTVSLNFQSVVAPFDLKLKVSMFIGVLASSPVWTYQLWAFVTPGLTRNERRYAIGFVLAAVPLFAVGAYLAYLFLGNAVRFLIAFTPVEFENLINAQDYLSFVMRIILAFGLSFIVPLVLVGLNFTGLVSAHAMISAWRWIVVLAFTFAAIATPTPDVLSMFLLALPLLALFGLAISVAWLNDRRRRRANRDTDYTGLADDEASAL
jgi:sec-independent protein translocase protein TatC